MKTLKDVKIGETATVVKLHGEGAVKRRIMDMGLTKLFEMSERARIKSLEHRIKLLIEAYGL